MNWTILLYFRHTPFIYLVTADWENAMCTLILVVLICSRFGELALRSVAACRDQAHGGEGLLRRARCEEGRRPG